MKLYLENDQSVNCSKANKPPSFDTEKGEWYDIGNAFVDGKEVTFYMFQRYYNPDSYHIDTNEYAYFQIDSQWYKTDAYPDVIYLDKEMLELSAYIEAGGTFTTDKMNTRRNGVEEYDISQLELISEMLEHVMNKINKYNPYIEAQMKDGKLLFINNNASS